MSISVDLIKELRNRTGAGVNDCRLALKETGNNLDEAIKFLKKKGLELVKEKQDNIAKQGKVEAYIHTGGKVGVLVEVNSQTDFVANTIEFVTFTKDIAMQITAMDPRYIRKEDVPKDVIDKEPDIDKFYEKNCLLEQPFIKDQNIKIKDYLHSLIAKTGENIVIRRFSRFQLGQE